MRIALVTRAHTRNQGNVTLSRVWRALLQDIFAPGQVVVLERVPDYLTRFTLADIAASADPLAMVDVLAARLASAGTNRVAGGPGVDITLNLNPSRVSKSSTLRRLIRPRSRLAKLGLFRAGFDDRQALMRSCDVVVMNAAGEFRSDLTDTPLRYLLDLRAAQLSGRKTAFVNTSLEIANPTLLSIAVYVLDKCNVLLFRDDDSLAHFRKAGGRASAGVISDAALLHGNLIEPSVESSRVAIAMSGGADAHQFHHLWLDIARRVEAGGRKPVFVSNEWQTDEPVFRPWCDQYGYEAVGRGLDVDAYAHLLNGFDALITGRLHSGVLAVIAGTPIIPVELGTFKMHGLFSRIGIDCCSANSLVDDATIDAALAPLNLVKADWLRDQRQMLPAERDRIRIAVTEQLGRLRDH